MLSCPFFYTIIIVVVVVLLLCHYCSYEPFVVDYKATNYNIARGNDHIHRPLVWDKPARIQKALIVPSLDALRFRDTNQSVLQTIASTKRDIVRDCAVQRTADTIKVDSTLARVNALIAKNDMVMELARKRTQYVKDHFLELFDTQNEFKKKLQLKCRMTVDNFLEQAYFNNEKLFERGNYKNWQAPKTFHISNFKYGRVFACKCGDTESTSTDKTYNHSEHAGLIITSENDAYFSTFTYWPFNSGTADAGKEKNWRVYHSTHNDRGPPEQNGVKWYEAEYDDSDTSLWTLPTRSTSGFYLKGVKWYEAIYENYFKIWGGENNNKYVWFRYKDRS